MPELDPQQTVTDVAANGESQVVVDDALTIEMLVEEVSIDGMCGVY
jgi:mycofactocin precursor